MNIALVLAAGSGKRIGGDTPKQFLLIKDKPLLAYSLEAFNKNPSIDVIYVVSQKEYVSNVKDIIKTYHLNKVKGIIHGGETRQESTFLGLLALKNKYNDDDIVLIHDSARPLVSQNIISMNVDYALAYDATVTALPVSDSVINKNDFEEANEQLDRNNILLEQTPQSFKLGLILDIHKKAYQEKISGTSDCGLAIKYGVKVHIAIGEPNNNKVTTKDDLDKLESLL